jgi:hypothetical protein
MATIFLDMDGVVADFDGYAEPIVGFRTPGGVRYDQEGWALISANPRLYSELGEMPDAHRLVKEVQQLAKENSMDVKFLQLSLDRMMCLGRSGIRSNGSKHVGLRYLYGLVHTAMRNVSIVVQVIS